MWRLTALLVLLLPLGGGVACRQTGVTPVVPAPDEASSEALSRPLPSPVPDPAARVNGQGIPLRSVAVLARQIVGDRIPEDKRPRLLREATRQLVIRELLYQEAVARHLTADQKVVAQAYDEARVAFRDDTLWSAHLAERGLDPEMLQTELQIKFTVQALLEQEKAQVAMAVTDEEARAFYTSHPSMFDTGERLRVRHILYRVPPDMDPKRKEELRTRIEGLLARIYRGEDFARLAGSHSEDPTSKDKGGELPIFYRGQKDPVFEKAAFALAPGQVSDVVETPAGFHIIKLQERLPSVRLDLEQAMPAIAQKLVERRVERGLEQLVSKLKAQARIEYYF